jgi:hypothetical protein
MGNPWLRLDAHYMSDSSLQLAGAEATLVWPHVLAALKRAQGVCSDKDLSPRALSRMVGGDQDLWEVGIDALKAEGLLVAGERTIKIGKAEAFTKSGWVTPGWDTYQPDARAGGWARSKKSDTVQDRTGPNRTERKDPERSGSSPDSRVASSPVGLSAPPSVDRKSAGVGVLDEDDVGDFDGWSPEGQLLDDVLSWAGVPSLAPGKPRKKLQLFARWLSENGGWSEPNFAEKRAYIEGKPHVRGTDKLGHLLNLLDDKGQPKPAPSKRVHKRERQPSQGHTVEDFRLQGAHPWPSDPLLASLLTWRGYEEALWPREGTSPQRLALDEVEAAVAAGVTDKAGFFAWVDARVAS